MNTSTLPSEREIKASLDRQESLVDGDEKPGFGTRLVRAFDDGRIMRTAFYAMLCGVGVVLYLDYEELNQLNAMNPIQPGMENPILPPVVRPVPALPNKVRSPAVTAPETSGDGEVRQAFRPDIKTPADSLRQPMTVKLGSEGTLVLSGTIHIGAFERFAQEVAERGEYIKQVELISPGGSVEDALSISKLIRAEGYTTLVRSGVLCASSCPLIFAGGVERIAEKGAAIGVHQIYAAEDSYTTTSQAIYSTQTITAEISRHLSDMGVDTLVWTFALETPPRQLYYFNDEELVQYNLAFMLEADDTGSQADGNTAPGN